MSPRFPLRMAALSGALFLMFLLLGTIGCGGSSSAVTHHDDEPIDEPEVSEAPCDGSEQVRVFDNSGILDDSFDILIDGVLAFTTPVGGGAANDNCLDDIPSGQHTLRIRFVLDSDDPTGTDSDENGTYGIVLSSGVTFLSGPGLTSDTTASGSQFPPGTFHDYVIDVP